MQHDTTISSRQPAAPGRPLAGRAQGLHWSIWLFVALMILPIGVSTNIGTLFMTPLKAFLILFTIPGLALLFIRGRLRAHDYLFLGYALWTFLAIMINRPFQQGLQTGGTFFMQSMTVYVLARLYMRRLEDFVSLTRLLFFIVLVLGIGAIPEAVLQERFIHNTVQKFTGYVLADQRDLRWGFLRASSVFSHQILFGLFCSAMLSLVWYLEPSGIRRWLKAGAVGIGTFFSLSSAPFLSFALQVIFIFAERFTRKLKNRFKIFAMGFVSLYVFLSLASNRGPIGLFGDLIAFNSATVWYRRLIWRFGIDDVWANPIFGLRPETWTRPFWMTGSMDNNWLLQAMRGGIPSVIFLFLAIFLILRGLYRQPGDVVGPLFENLRRGWSYTMASLLIGGATVAFFGNMEPFFAFLVGLGAALLRLEPARAALPDVAGARPKRGRPAREPKGPRSPGPDPAASRPARPERPPRPGRPARGSTGRRRV